MLKSRTPRIAAALSAAALTTAGLTAAVAPAGAATAAPVNYTCSALGGLAPGLKFAATADTDAPATLAFGRSVAPKLTAQISIDETTATLMRTAVDAKSISGTGDIQTLVNTAQSTTKVTIADTPVPASGPMTVTAKGVMSAIKGDKLGEKVVGLKDFTAVLMVNKNAGGDPQPVDVNCVQDAGQNNTVDTLKVVQGTSSTATRLAWNAKTKTLTATATVTPKATGRVSFVITKNGKRFKTVAVSLNARSQAVAKLARLRKGTYKVVAKYTGSATLKASTARAVSKKV